MSYALLLVAATYGAILFVVFAGLRVAGAADQAADRALLAMLDHRRRVVRSSSRAASAARPAPRRKAAAADFLATSYR